MKNWIAFVFSTLIATSLVAENFSIIIENEAYRDITLYLYRYENLLTEEEAFVTEIPVDNTGKVQMDCKIGAEPQLFFIPFYSFKLMFYAEPNKTVHLKMPSVEKIRNYFQKQKSYDDKEISLFITPKQSLNNEINSYNKTYGKLLQKYFKRLHQSKTPKLFWDKFSELYPQKKEQADFFSKYIAYKKGYIDYVAGLHIDIISKYFAHKPLLIQQPSYTLLLKKIAKDKVFDFVSTKDYVTYRDAKTYNTLNKLAKKLTGSADVAFNELFLISMIYEGTKAEFLQKHRSRKFLKIIRAHTQNQTNKVLVSSVLRTLFSGLVDEPVLPFTFVSIDGQKVTQQDLEGDTPTLLLFLDNEKNNANIIKEIADIQRQGTTPFKVLLFQCGFHSKEIKGMSWQQFFVPYQHKFLRDYQLGKFPYLVLMDKKGNVSKETWQHFFSRIKD